MKKILFAISAFLLIGSSNAQISIPNEQKSLYAIVEATWCGNCGQFGIPVTNQVISQVGSKAVFMTMHASTNSALYSPTAQALTAAFGASGQPHWTFNGASVGSYSGSIQNTMITNINNNYNATMSDVNTGYNWYVAGDTLYVETLTEFFNAANGDYYVAPYVIEDNVYAYQANYDPMIPNGNIFHKNILRTAVASTDFGDMIASGSINAGTQYPYTFKMKIDPAWNLNEIRVATVVWKRNGQAYDFENANDQGMQILGVESFTNATDIDIYPNPSISGLVYVNLNNLLNNPEIKLYNLEGKIVYQEKVNGMKRRSLKLDFTEMTPGSYFLSLTDSEKTISKKLVIK